MGAKADKPYDSLVATIAEIYTRGRVNSFKAVNTFLINTYWRIGQHIVELEQNGDIKARYGDGLLEQLSRDLTHSYGKGFSLNNVKRFRQFYLTYPIGATVSHQLGANNQPGQISAEPPHQSATDNQTTTKGAELPHFLSWTHYVELMKIENPLQQSLVDWMFIP